LPFKISHEGDAKNKKGERQLRKIKGAKGTKMGEKKVDARGGKLRGKKAEGV